MLVLEQGATAIAATLGTLRAGATYVPLDPGEPHVRLTALLDLVGSKAVLTDTDGAARMRRLRPSTPVIVADDERVAIDGPLPSVPADAPAYIYLTSGSTGRPKGVVDCHRNVLHNIMRYTNALEIGPTDRLSLVQSLAFSGAVSSTFAALMNGAAVFPRQLDGGNLGSLAAWLASERVTIYHSVPSILRSALASADMLPNVRVVRLEGDRSYGQDMATWQRHFSPGTLIANGLGTTETGLCRQLIVPVDSHMNEGIMPVGYEVADMEITVLDDEGRQLETGTAGEIAVSSAYLATGYWAEEGLTASAFTRSPGSSDRRTYRTGDLGRLRTDGCLEYLGRRDGLSKVLGHRVEPAEVEAALATIPGVRAAAVRIIQTRRGEGQVVAYFVGPPDLDDPALRSAAAARLPRHMRPVRYIRLEELPLGPNGKVDRASLPEPRPEEGSGPPRPTDPMEARVAAIMADVIERPVGRDDDFFLAGGDSLAAAEVLAALERETGRRLPASTILRAPTVARLAALLGTQAATSGTALYPLSEEVEAQPLVLLHSHEAYALMYALLARHLRAVRPVWTLEAEYQSSSSDEPPTMAALARHGIEILRQAQPVGPYSLGGYCYAGVVAFEMAHQLLQAGEEVDELVLIGVTPHDFPSLVSADAREHWTASRRTPSRLRLAISSVGEVMAPEARSYVATRYRAGLNRVRARASSEGRTQRHVHAAAASVFHSAFDDYRAEPLPGHVTLLLSAWSVPEYTTEPRSAWAGLASNVEIHVLPGSARTILSEPTVSSVAAILARDPATVASEGRKNRSGRPASIGDEVER